MLFSLIRYPMMLSCSRALLLQAAAAKLTAAGCCCCFCLFNGHAFAHAYPNWLWFNICARRWREQAQLTPLISLLHGSITFRGHGYNARWLWLRAAAAIISLAPAAAVR